MYEFFFQKYKMDSLGGANLTGRQKEELMDKVKQEIALANFQELLTVKILLYYFFIKF